jgi:hypothetical protein
MPIDFSFPMITLDMSRFSDMMGEVNQMPGAISRALNRATR